MRWIFLAPFLVLSSLCIGQVPSYVPQDGLVAWYDFADGACDVAGLAGCFDLIDGAHIGEIEGSDDLALRLDGNYLLNNEWIHLRAVGDEWFKPWYDH